MVDDFYDFPLTESEYIIAVVFYNEANGKYAYKTLYNYESEELESSSKIWILLLLLLIPIAAILYYIM